MPEPLTADPTPRFDTADDLPRPLLTAGLVAATALAVGLYGYFFEGWIDAARIMIGIGRSYLVVPLALPGLFVTSAVVSGAWFLLARKPPSWLRAFWFASVGLALGAFPFEFLFAIVFAVWKGLGPVR